MTRIYTKTGDRGETMLASGIRVPKDDPRLEAIGSIDELNSFIGLAIAQGAAPDLQPILIGIQNTLFEVGSDLTFPRKDEKGHLIQRLEERQIHDLEESIDRLTESLNPLRHFILPGGSPAGAILHCARSVCRRAERRAIAIQWKEGEGKLAIQYLNRLSDLLFTMARFQNQVDGVDEIQRGVKSSNKE